MGARSIADAHHFLHEAMATVFELYIVEEDGDYARQGAQAAFAEFLVLSDTSDKGLEQVFNAIDVDGSGAIDGDELQEYITKT